jgi:integrase
LPGQDIVTAAILSGNLPPSLQRVVDDIARHGGVLFGQTLADPSPANQSPADLQPDNTSLLKRALGELLLRSIVDGEPLPPSLAEHLSPARNAAVERAVKEIRGEQITDPARTVGAMVEDWLGTQKVQVTIGGITAAWLRNARLAIAHFTAFLGETADISALNAESLEGFHNFCLSKIADRRADAKGGWSAPFAKSVFGVARKMVRWLMERGTISPPQNFNRQWRFGPTSKQIATLTVDEVKSIIGKSSGKLKAALLLMLNCGMTQKDVSDLRDDEVDWREGRVIRKRSKTMMLESVPVVNYKLWPSTFALLKEHRSGQDRVLLTDSNRHWVRKDLIGNKVVQCDSLAEVYRRFAKRFGPVKPMKLLRKTSASLLESHETYGRFTSLFLGHSPKSIKDRHYAAPPQELFDAAVTWLGEKLGVAEDGSKAN